MQAKFVFEKFTDQSNPVHDLGIGIPYIIKNSIEKIFKESAKNPPYVYSIWTKKENFHNIGESAIATIDIFPDNDIIKINCYSDRYYDKNENEIDKKEYVIKLLKLVGIFKYIKSIEVERIGSFTESGSYAPYEFTIKIKPQYTKYFTTGHYNAFMYIKESLNEKFTDESDPIKDLQIGYPEKQINTKSWQVLKFIESKGKEGASLKEIQHFIWILNGHSEKSFWEKDKTRSKYYFDSYPQRKTRGYWNTNLLGSNSAYWGASYGGHPGLLHKYCKQNPVTHKWILEKMPKPRERFYK